jgi:hypothetical protein
MNDSEARGVILKRLYDIRHEVTRAQFHHFDDLHLELNILANILEQLAQKNLIDWTPHRSSSTGNIDTFMARINASGVDVVEGTALSPISITIDRSVATQSETAETTGPVLPVTPKPTASTTPTMVELAARATLQSNASLGLSVNRTNPAATPIGADGAFVGSLLEHPAEIREAARALSKAIADQIGQLNASKPNDAESLAKQNDFVAFLEMIATGLNHLADALDQAIATGTNGSLEPIFLGRAGEIAKQLSTTVKEGLERHRTYIADCAIRFGVFGAGFVFLHACGVDGYIAGAVAALMNLRLPGRPKGTA